MAEDTLPYSTYCDAVSREVARIGEVARAHDLTATVPSCRRVDTRRRGPAPRPAPAVVRRHDRPPFTHTVANLRGRLRPAVRLDPDSFGLAPAVPDPDATISAEAAEALLLLVYGRIGADDPQIKTTGDPALLERWFTHSKF